MQKNTKTISLAAIVAIIGIASISIATLDTSFEESGMNTQEITTQVIRGSMPNYSLEDLASGTKYAIVGTVKQITPVIVETDRMNPTVFSDVVVKVQKDLNGDYDQKEITVRIQGGTLGDMVTISHVSANFEMNQRVLFFVPEKDLDSIWSDNYYVAGGYLGKYTLDDGNAIRDSINDSISEDELVSKIQKVRGL